MDAAKALNRNSFLAFSALVLQQIALRHNQDIYFNSPIPADLCATKQTVNAQFDAIAPNGFDNIKGPAIFEFKYTQKSISHDTLQSTINSVYKKTMQLTFLELTVVLVTNSSYSSTISVGEDSCKKTSHKNCVDFKIWDRNTINRWAAQYPIDYSNVQNAGANSAAIESEQNITEADFYAKSQSNLEAIKRVIECDDNFAFVLGAGVSISPGAKSWDQLLEYFTDELKKKNIINDDGRLKKKIGGSSIITAQLCKELYPKEQDYYWAIHQGLYEGRKAINQDFALYHIAEISKQCVSKAHFRIITYNYDNYLESYMKDIGITANSLFDSHSGINDQLSVYHVHGYLPEVKFKTHIRAEHQKSIYLTEEDYNSLYNNPYSWQISSQLSFFRENTCLFVGCSLADPNIRRLLEMTGKEGRIHYAILTRDNMNTKDLITASNHFHRMGIEVIWVNNYEEITQKLCYLQN